MLHISNLKKGFQRTGEIFLPVVSIDELVLEKSKMVAIHGESGSGKTTFLNLIAGLLVPDEGKIYLDGIALHELTESKRDFLRATSIGYIFQSFHLLQSCSALENLLIAMSFGGQANQAKAKEMLDLVGLKDRMSHKPGDMSVGQQQRVALARALINQPSLLLADEPTGNLDAQNAQNSLNLMKELCASTGASMMIVSHDPYVIHAFDHQVAWDDLNLVSKHQTCS
ncbi:MAG: ABC transporter ATP-binding protein [Opitutales bacterium]|nr:ABC transporter ATP-binding protein [Opitutales bacterium]